MTNPINDYRDAVKRNEAAGQTWFGKNEMRFFGTIVEKPFYPCPAREVTYFVTSEKPPHARRAWAVRCISWATGTVDTIGSVCDYKSAASARKVANGLAQQVIS